MAIPDRSVMGKWLSLAGGCAQCNTLLLWVVCNAHERKETPMGVLGGAETSPTTFAQQLIRVWGAVVYLLGGSTQSVCRPQMPNP